MKNVFLSLFILILLTLYPQLLYCMKQDKQVVAFYKNKHTFHLPPLEKAPRNLISRIKLLECHEKRYQENDSEFYSKELKNLYKILEQKIENELIILKNYQSSSAKEFLTLVDKNNFFYSKNQKILFERLSPIKHTVNKNHIKITENDTIPKDIIIASIIGPLIFCFLIFGYII